MGGWPGWPAVAPEVVRLINVFGRLSASGVPLVYLKSRSLRVAIFFFDEVMVTRVEVEANTSEEAIQKYEDGDFDDGGFELFSDWVLVGSISSREESKSIPVGWNVEESGV